VSIRIDLGSMFPKFIFSRTEAKILDTIVKEKSGNAYSLWKASGLKHYPTVLRALKKLEEKRLVQVLSEKGMRGERTYTPTLVGTLITYKVKGEEKKIVEMVEKNSSLFRELYKIDKDDNWALRVFSEIMMDFYRKIEPRSFDAIIRKEVESWLDDYFLNRLGEDPEWITKLSKVKWIRPLALKLIEDEIDWLKTNIEELNKLQMLFTK